MMNIIYQINTLISTDQFIELLCSSSLGERRPVDNRDCMSGMLKNSNLIVSAWSDNQLVGMARSVTDFCYCCYLSDLVVNENYQGLGIGKKLQSLTQKQLGSECKIILIAAPNANSYYEHIGFENNERCWVLDRDSCIANSL